MADAYATVANGGVHYDPECIVPSRTSNGNVIVDNTDPTGERVFSREVARAALDCMEVVIDNGTGKAGLSRQRSGEAGGKTGTTDDKKDSWFCGVTPQGRRHLAGRPPDYLKAEATTTTAASVRRFHR